MNCTYEIQQRVFRRKKEERIIQRVCDNTGCVDIVTVMAGVDRGTGEFRWRKDMNSFMHQMFDDSEFKTVEAYDSVEALISQNVERFL